MLPILPFCEFVPTIQDCFARLTADDTLRQNEAHGLILRASVFLEAYFKYRSIATLDHSNFAEDEAQIFEVLARFQEHLPKWKKYSKMTWALFIRTFRKTLSQLNPSIYNDALAGLFTAYTETVKIYLNDDFVAKLALEDQAYLKECLKMKLDLSIYQHNFTQARLLFQRVVFDLLLHHIDIVVIFMKAFKKKLGQYKEGFRSENEEICKFLVLTNFIDKVKSEKKEDGVFKYNKVLQLTLQILHKAWKRCLDRPAGQAVAWSNHVQFRTRVLGALADITEKFPKNSNLTAALIKLNTVAALYFIADGDSFELTEEHVTEMSQQLLKYAYSDQREIVRVAAAKSLISLIPVIVTRPYSQNLFY